MIVDGGYVYWADRSSTVSRVAIAGGAPAPIRQQQAVPWGLAADDAYIYWSTQLGGAIWRGAKDGSGNPEIVVRATEPRDIAIFRDNLYWIDTAAVNVWVVPKAGGVGSVGATPTNDGMSGGILRLMGTSMGPFTRSFGGYHWYSYDVVRQRQIAKGGLTDGNIGMAFDGTNFYYNQPPSCQVDALNVNTGQSAGCFFKGVDISDNDFALAASGCGVFYDGSSRPAGPKGLQLAHLGAVYGMPIFGTRVDVAVIAGSFLYFHSKSESKVGRIPLP